VPAAGDVRIDRIRQQGFPGAGHLRTVDHPQDAQIPILNQQWGRIREAAS